MIAPAIHHVILSSRALMAAIELYASANLVFAPHWKIPLYTGTSTRSSIDFILTTTTTIPSINQPQNTPALRVPTSPPPTLYDTTRYEQRYPRSHITHHQSTSTINSQSYSRSHHRHHPSDHIILEFPVLCILSHIHFSRLDMYLLWSGQARGLWG